MSGLESPISFEFIAAGIARRARMAITRLLPSQVAKHIPSWDGSDGQIQTTDLTLPVTDIGYWAGRYVLTSLTLQKEDNTELVMPEAVVNLSMTKTIKEESLVGLAGTIKEYICNGDYQIGIEVGIVAVENGRIVDKYPEQGVRTVREFLEESAALRVKSVFLDLFDINQLVVKTYSLKQETASNRQLLTISAVSDMDYVIMNVEY